MTTDSFEARGLDLPGVILITPKRFTDSRGFSLNAYDAEQFAALGIVSAFIQDYASFSKKNVIRGLHYQRPPHTQDKLIRCTTGRIFDVVADYNHDSRTSGTYISIELDASKSEMLYVPGRYAHGFCVLNDEGAIVEYKIAGAYYPEAASGIRYDDPTLAIAWPAADPILSDKDKAWPMLPAPVL